MVRPKGIKQAEYIRPLTQALGWKANYQKTRDVIKKQGHIYPYNGHEKEALEFFLAQGHDLSNYTPIEPAAIDFLEKHYGKVKHHTSLVVTQHSLPLAEETDEQERQAPWTKRLISRLAKLFTEVDDEVKQKILARKLLTDGGYPKPEKGTWTDEKRALKIYKDAGRSIDGFEYEDGRVEAGSGDAITHLPANVSHMSPTALKLEVARLNRSVAELSQEVRMLGMRLKHGSEILDRAVGSIYADIARKRESGIDIRPTEGELWADMALRELQKE
jgi:hypothetical protein